MQADAARDQVPMAVAIDSDDNRTMHRAPRLVRSTLISMFALAVPALLACSNSNNASSTAPEQAGQACKAPTDCYPGIEAGALKGAVQCLDRVTNGYCTHLCTTDSDCCAVPGECRTGVKQVCAPFESTGQMMCFLSCETADVAADAGTTDTTVYCQRFANPTFGCRSTGGGKTNRTVCVP